MKYNFIINNLICLLLFSSFQIDSKLDLVHQNYNDIELTINKLVVEGIIKLEPKVEINHIFRLMNLVNYKEVIIYLLEHGLDVNAKCNGSAMTLLNLLMIASSMGDLNLCELLIKHGAIINAKNEEEQTALMFAAFYGHDKVVEYLINNGARFDECDSEGNVILLNSVIRNNIEVGKILIKNGLEIKSEVRTFFYATALRNIEAIELFINNGFNVNSIYYGAHNHNYLEIDGMPALRLVLFLLSEDGLKMLEQQKLLTNMPTALKKLNQEVIEIVELLLKNGADADANGSKPNPLSLMIFRNKEIAKLLLEYGANPNIMIKSDYTFSLLSIAVAKGDIEITKLLLNYGADINLLSDFSTTALFYAPNKKIAELLMEKCYDINHQALNGDTALHWAVQLERAEVVEFLIEKGADITIQNLQGSTGLDIAKSLKNQTIIDLFVKKMLDN